jgi:NAD(P)-dependent dehydrogenase (short-subunit alcohol dehydrogenase family)
VLKDLAGKTLMPGFIDGHAHAQQFGMQAVGANLLAPPDGTVNTIDDLVDRLKAFAAGPDVGLTGWIFGVGYDDALLGRHPTREDLDKVYNGCVVAPYEFLKATLPPMVAQRSGQVLLITSASAARPTPGAPLYSSMRSAATMLAKNSAMEMAKNNVQVNAVGTNFMDFPEFRRASGADDPETRKKIESQVPLNRLGGVDEFAHFCMPYLDGKSTFATGQFVSFSGGWS